MTVTGDTLAQALLFESFERHIDAEGLGMTDATCFLMRVSNGAARQDL